MSRFIYNPQRLHCNAELVCTKWNLPGMEPVVFTITYHGIEKDSGVMQFYPTVSWFFDLDIFYPYRHNHGCDLYNVAFPLLEFYLILPDQINLQFLLWHMYHFWKDV